MTEHATIAEALVAALAAMPSITKDESADAGSYTYDYASLASIVHAVRPVLAEHGLAPFQNVHRDDAGLAVTTTILHVSGEREECGPLSFPRGNNPQTTGSAISYFRRYALLAALGLAPEDDDGAAASAPTPSAPAPTGITSAVLGERITECLMRFNVADPDGDHAKAIWRKATPKTAEDGLIYQSETDRVLGIAEDYIANMDDVVDGEAF